MSATVAKDGAGVRYEVGEPLEGLYIGFFVWGGVSVHFEEEREPSRYGLHFVNNNARRGRKAMCFFVGPVRIV